MLITADLYKYFFDADEIEAYFRFNRALDEKNKTFIKNLIPYQHFWAKKGEATANHWLEGEMDWNIYEGADAGHDLLLKNNQTVQVKNICRIYYDYRMNRGARGIKSDYGVLVRTCWDITPEVIAIEDEALRMEKLYLDQPHIVVGWASRDELNGGVKKLDLEVQGKKVKIYAFPQDKLHPFRELLQLLDLPTDPDKLVKKSSARKEYNYDERIINTHEIKSAKLL